MGETVKNRTTKKQAKANRTNATKSTGPRTAEGKARVRLNAVKHGLRAEQVVVLGGPTAEDPAEFDSLLSGMLDDCKPAGALERVLVERLAVSYWRLRRAYRFEARAIERANEPNPMSKMLEELSQLPLNKPGLQELPGLRSLDKLVRYELMIDRELLRTATQLQHLQHTRKLEEEDADPEPGPSASGPSADRRDSGPQPVFDPGPDELGRVEAQTRREGCGSSGRRRTRAPLKSGGTSADHRPDARNTSALRSTQRSTATARPTRGSAATERPTLAGNMCPSRGRAKGRRTSVAEQSHLDGRQRPARVCRWGGVRRGRIVDTAGRWARRGGVAMIERSSA
ncbi:MAG: hypothetical protein O7D91_13585 [Planctomycetota bacterium]|nr:hypothetical protein [Planctomycetota bacterium]